MYVIQLKKKEQEKIAKILLKKGIRREALKRAFCSKLSDLDYLLKEEEKWKIFTD